MSSSTKSFIEMLEDRVRRIDESHSSSDFRTIHDPHQMAWMMAQNSRFESRIEGVKATPYYGEKVRVEAQKKGPVHEEKNAPQTSQKEDTPHSETAKLKAEEVFHGATLMGFHQMNMVAKRLALSAVELDFEPSELRKLYRKLLLKLHPDSGSQADPETLQLVIRCYRRMDQALREQSAPEQRAA